MSFRISSTSAIKPGVSSDVISTSTFVFSAAFVRYGFQVTAISTSPATTAAAAFSGDMLTIVTSASDSPFCLSK
jgi:hypothetical protein